MQIYGMSGDFMLIPQDLIPETIPSQKCHTKMGLILDSHGDIGMWNTG
jgi:hypothetical protein